MAIANSANSSNLCPRCNLFCHASPVDGVFQEYVAHEADLFSKLPENVDTMEGALIEPLAVGFHHNARRSPYGTRRAVVLDQAVLGLFTMMALKDLGVDQVM